MLWDRVAQLQKMLKDDLQRRPNALDTTAKMRARNPPHPKGESHMEAFPTSQQTVPQDTAVGTNTLATAAIDEEDRHFKRRVGWISLAMLTFSGMVGSGWLFASY